VELCPEAHEVRRKPGCGHGGQDGGVQVVDVEYLGARVAAELNRAAAVQPPQLAGVLVAQKEAGQGILSRQVEQFGAWRGSAASGHQGALQARAQALQDAAQQSAVATN
jgi:hypothetical protein